MAVAAPSEPRRGQGSQTAAAVLRIVGPAGQDGHGGCGGRGGRRNLDNGYGGRRGASQLWLTAPAAGAPFCHPSPPITVSPACSPDPLRNRPRPRRAPCPPAQGVVAQSSPAGPASCCFAYQLCQPSEQLLANRLPRSGGASLHHRAVGRAARCHLCSRAVWLDCDASSAGNSGFGPQPMELGGVKGEFPCGACQWAFQPTVAPRLVCSLLFRDFDGFSAPAEVLEGF